MRPKKKITDRGFGVIEFEDCYGTGCSIQESSSAVEPRIWLGVDNAWPRILASKADIYGINSEQTTGWIPYPIPKDVLLTTRMHLSQKEVKRLMPYLKRFLKTGELLSSRG